LKNRVELLEQLLPQLSLGLVGLLALAFRFCCRLPCAICFRNELLLLGKCGLACLFCHLLLAISLGSRELHFCGQLLPLCNSGLTRFFSLLLLTIDFRPGSLSLLLLVLGRCERLGFSRFSRSTIRLRLDPAGEPLLPL